MPISGVWLQDWVGQRRTGFGDRLWWNWELDEQRYGEWQRLTQDLRARGIRVLAYLNPFLADDVAEHVHERDLFAEAKARGYLVRNEANEIYRLYQGDFYAGLVDLTNDEARRWLKDIAASAFVELGVSGWMADFAEGLPYDAVLASGESASRAHNLYAEWWAELNRDVIQEAGLEGEAFAFHRSGYTRSPRAATLFWLGDQLVSWDSHDGMPTALVGLLSSGFSGFSLNHSDTGGYTAITDFPFNYRRSQELFKRWAEMNAFTTVLRTHEGNRPADNHQVYDDTDTARHFARMARLYLGWRDYRRELVAQASKTGVPVVRHLFLHYPEDEAVVDLDRQFLVGSDLLIAPIFRPGATSVELYLPAGEWVHLWSGAVRSSAAGKWIEVAAPLGEPAVFYREGAAVGAELEAALSGVVAEAE